MSGRIGERGRRALSAVVALAIAVPFYWLLIDSLYEPDLIAGGVAVLIAAAVYSAGYMEASENAAIRLRWFPMVLKQLARVPAGIVIVCVEVLSQTFSPRPRRGVIQADPFEAGDDDDPYDLGRRALAEATRSFAPNTVVIGIDPDSDRLLLHRLGPKL